MANPSAAESAYSSGMSAAQTQMDPTGPQTSPPSMTSGGGASGGGASGASGAGTSGAAGRLAPLVSTGGVISSMIGAVAAVAGGAWLLM